MVSNMKEISILEKEIGINFESNQNLLRTAFIHSSYANEHEGCEHNERLEFLGDAVLGLVIAEYYYNNFQGREGELTKKRESVVKNMMLAQVADEMCIGEFLLVGEGEKENKDEKARQKRIGNAIEALIGVIFLHTNYQIARKFITDKFLLYRDYFIIENFNTNLKGKFQEEAQKRGYRNPPCYKVCDEWESDNKKHFRIGLYLGDEKVSEGEGTNKKEAEKKAAENGLKAKEWNIESESL